MHHHLEIVMPPVEDVEKAVSGIMEPFSEYYEDNTQAFWD